jgi:hypothetical protein
MTCAIEVIGGNALPEWEVAVGCLRMGFDKQPNT